WDGDVRRQSRNSAGRVPLDSRPRSVARRPALHRCAEENEFAIPLHGGRHAMNFIDELRRRNVIRMAGLYLVAAWLAVQVSSTVLPMFDAPSWVPRAIVVLLAIGFVPALVFAWVFELTPQGVKRESAIDRSDSITPKTG